MSTLTDTSLLKQDYSVIKTVQCAMVFMVHRRVIFHATEPVCHEVCDTWPVSRQIYGHRFSRRAASGTRLYGLVTEAHAC